MSESTPNLWINDYAFLDLALPHALVLTRNDQQSLLILAQGRGEVAFSEEHPPLVGIDESNSQSVPVIGLALETVAQIDELMGALQVLREQMVAMPKAQA